MATPLVLVLVATLVLAGTLLYFLMASIGLLFVKHRDPVDSSVVRGVFATYDRVLAVVATAAAACYVAAGLRPLALWAGALAVLAVVSHRVVVPRMAALHARLRAGDGSAARRFRRWHVAAIVAKVVLLAATVAVSVANPVDLGARPPGVSAPRPSP